MMARRRRTLVVVVALAACSAAVQWGNDGLRILEDSKRSRAIGSPSAGRLEKGKRLPTSGRNFVAYSRIGTLLGRNSVHSALRNAIVDAYQLLEGSAPGAHFTYGETGWPTGGRFRPHRTHQNGMSADFMVPVVDVSSGGPVLFPSSPLNKFGYSMEFDKRGVCGEYQIDFEILARHLRALEEAARRHGLVIAKVILAPEYLPLLWSTPTGGRLRGKLPFMNKSAWIRHDEHYHIDFAPSAG